MIIEYFGLSKSGKTTELLKKRKEGKQYLHPNDYSFLMKVFMFIKYFFLHPFGTTYLFYKLNTNWIEKFNFGVFFMRNSYLMAVLSKAELLKLYKGDVYVDEYSLQSLFMIFNKQTNLTEVKKVIRYLPKSDKVEIKTASKRIRYNRLKKIGYPAGYIDKEFSLKFMKNMELNYKIFLKAILHKKLRIAIFEPSRLFQGGGQKNIPRTASYLSKNHDVTILIQRLPKEKEIKFKGCKIKYLWPKSIFLAPIAFLLKKLNKWDYDLVIYGSFPAVLANLRNDIPSIYVAHSPPRSFYDLKEHMYEHAPIIKKAKLKIKEILFKKLEYVSVKKMDVILSVSKEISKRIKKYYDKDSIIYPSGINPNEFKTGRYSNYILSVCRLVSAKRPEMIIDGMNYVKNKKIKLIMVGTGNMEEDILHLSGKNPNIIFKGFVNDNELKKLYSNCLAVVYIPLNEDLGYAPLEASASGKATIGVDEGGLKDSIIDGITGFRIKNITPKKLATKIDFLSNNKGKAREMGRNAKRFNKRFHLKTTFKTLDNAIKEILFLYKIPISIS